MDRREGSDSKLPLHDEAVAREKWRGGETLSGGKDDHELPASAVDDAGGQAGQGDENDGRPGHGRPGAFPPPD